MNDTLPRRVGQKLHFARIHLRELEKMAGLSATDLLSRRVAYSESFAFHLTGAVRCHLIEVAGFYKIDPLPAPDLESMLSLLAERCGASPEISELRILASRGDSWLKRLAVFYHACSEGIGVNSEPARNGLESHMTLLDLQELAEQRAVLPTVAECASWLSAAMELIERQRQGMAQW